MKHHLGFFLQLAVLALLPVLVVFQLKQQPMLKHKSKKSSPTSVISMQMQTG